MKMDNKTMPDYEGAIEIVNKLSLYYSKQGEENFERSNEIANIVNGLDIMVRVLNENADVSLYSPKNDFMLYHSDSLKSHETLYFIRDNLVDYLNGKDYDFGDIDLDSITNS